ncbi:MAG: DUF5655 domain-containing protein [Coriobacteriia bacterium]
MTLDDFFGDHDDSRLLFDAVRACVESIGDAELRVSKSQVGFYRRTGFASVWMPGQYLGKTGVPLVLTVALRRRDMSPRWKEVVEPAPGRFTHHLELRSPDQIDVEVRDWLAEAWALAE